MRIKGKWAMRTLREGRDLTKMPYGTMFAKNVPVMQSGIFKRSSVYHLLNTIAPINHKLKAELDILGCTVIVAFALFVVTVVRLVWFGGAQ
jgi:hypothetical protein